MKLAVLRLLQISNVNYLLMENIYPSYLIEKQVKRLLCQSCNKFYTYNHNTVKKLK